MSVIQCETRIVNIADWAVVHLPREASEHLSSRGIATIEGTLNDLTFMILLEPDGKGSHWFRVSDHFLKEGNLRVGDKVKLVFTQTYNWPDPDLPPDLEDALKQASLYDRIWQKLSPRAKWEWIRWIRSAKHEETRSKRIELALDKLNKGLKTPCCFNSASCTEPHVSRNGILLDETCYVT